MARDPGSGDHPGRRRAVAKGEADQGPPLCERRG